MTSKAGRVVVESRSHGAPPPLQARSEGRIVDVETGHEQPALAGRQHEYRRGSVAVNVRAPGPHSHQLTVPRSPSGSGGGPSGSVEAVGGCRRPLIRRRPSRPSSSTQPTPSRTASGAVARTDSPDGSGAT